MKLTKYFMPFAALALLASCSNDNLDAPGGAQQNVPADNALYLAVNVNLPYVNGTRDSFNKYDDGIAEEYQVMNGELWLFEEPANWDKDENKLIFHSAKDLASAWDLDKGNVDITSVSTTATAQFENIDQATGKKYYGLVVLNKSEDFPTITKGVEFGTWKAKKHSKGGDLGSFVMTNAPGSTTEFTGFTGVNYLVEIAADKFSPSLKNLEPAADFYVQREVAKATLVAGDKNGEAQDLGKFAVTMPENSTENDYVVFTAWDLTVTNNFVLPVQNVDNLDTWKTNNTLAPFIANSGKFRRIFWAEDANYDKADGEYTNGNTQTPEFNTIGADAVNIDIEEAIYALENTMQPTSMTEGQTTTAILKANYYVNPQGEQSTWTAKSFITYGTLRVEVDKTKLNSEKNSVGSKTIALNDLITDAEYRKSIMDEMGVANPAIEVSYFADGVCYYEVRIRHFDDSEAHLDRAAWKAKDYVYDGSHTGRFGMVRNNWYEVTINSVSGVGEPEFPTPDPNDPDDPKNDKYYINATINVLAWAKRIIGYDL